MKKIFSLLLAGLTLGAFTLSGCTPAATADQDAQPSFTPAQSDPSAQTDGGVAAPSTSFAYGTEDTDASWDDTATTIALSDGGSSIDGSGAAADGSTITISQAGTYVLSGSLSDGQIVVNAKSAIVRLVLNGVSIASSSTAPIYAEDAEKTILILADGTDNTVEESEGFAFTGGEDGPDSTIYVQDDLTITGGGSLTVVSRNNNAITAKDILRVTNGNVTVNAANDGLRGRDGVGILGGTFNITAANDGIKANNDEDAAKGLIVIDSGAFNITAQSDGIQAETSLLVTGGTFNITTGGGSANAPVREVEQFPGRGQGGWPDGGQGGGPGEGGRGAPNNADGNAESTAFNGQTAAQATPDPQTASGAQTGDAQAADSESTSMKAFKATTALTITGGAFTVDAEDDAFHSNGDLSVSGGTFAIKTGDDAFHADAALRIDDGTIDIQQCYEGIEGATVEQSGGVIAITATDDAINAAGGTDGTDGGGFGQRGADTFVANSDYYIRITGGELDATAGGDTLDSNGDIFISGGTLRLNGPSMGMEAAIDCDGSFELTGGNLAAFGSVITPATASQNLLSVYFTAEQPIGTTIELRDAAGTALAQYTSKIAASAAAFSLPELTTGQTYALYVDGVKTGDITLSEGATSVSEDGTPYEGGTMPGPGGMMPGGQLPDGAELPEGWQPPQGGQRPQGGGRPPDGSALPDGEPPTLPDGATPGEMPSNNPPA